jgi:hypothetical protein
MSECSLRQWAGWLVVRTSFSLPPSNLVTPSPVALDFTLFCFTECVIEGDPNHVIAVAAASEVGAETTPNRGRIISGVRG